MNGDEQLRGIHLERISFKDKLAVDIKSFRSPGWQLSSLFPEIKSGEVSDSAVLKVITSFYAGMQYAYDKAFGEKSIPKVWIGDHKHKGQPLTRPAYHSDYGILIPRNYITEIAKLPDDYVVRKISGEGKHIGNLPLFAWIGEGGQKK